MCLKSELGNILGFVTNIKDYKSRDLADLPKEYKKRWGIETGYRDAKRVMPRTISRNAVIRLFMFFVSLLISNIWMLSRAKNRRDTRLTVLLACMVCHATGMAV